MSPQEASWLLAEKYSGKQTPAFFADLELLQSGTPLAYLIGSVPFLDTTIYLDSHPLIPRPETEFWTEKAISEIEKYTHPDGNPRGSSPGSPLGSVKVLDLCAGSGAIGVAVLKAVSEAHVTFGEIEEEHLRTIGKNLAENNVDCTRYRVLQSDLFENIDGTFDFILTNPPYIDPALDRTEVSVKTHEPHVALYGGVRGMELIAKIISKAPSYLTSNGQVWVEHEPEQSAEIADLADKNGFTAVTHKDQYDTERYSVLKRTALE